MKKSIFTLALSMLAMLALGFTANAQTTDFFVKGTVYMPDGSVAVNASVSISDGVNFAQTVKSGNDGSYVITSIPANVNSSFYFTAYDSNWEYYFEKSVTFPSTTGNVYDIQLKGQTYMLFLYVEDADHNPLAGVTVQPNTTDDVYTTDDEGGVFMEFDTFDQVMGLELTLTKEGYETLVLPVEWGMDFFFETAVTMQPATEPEPEYFVKGTVYMPDGTVAVNASVSISDGVNFGQTVKTGNDGSYMITNIPANVNSSFYFTAYDSNWEYYFEKSVTFPSTTGNVYDIQLKGQTYMLFLYVEDADHNPLAGVTVQPNTTDDVYTTDDEGGVFMEFDTFDQVMGLELTLTKEGYETLVLPVEWGMDFFFETVATMQPAANFIRGDVNGDQSVNIADVTALIDYLLSGETTPQAADCNNDSNVNISDVTALIDYLLSGTWN